MTDDRLFQLWLVLLSASLMGLGAVLWWFALKVLEMHKEYATKGEMKEAKDGWQNEIEKLREDRARDHAENSRKLDKIDIAVTGIHSRIDVLFQQR